MRGDRTVGNDVEIVQGGRVRVEEKGRESG